jgi:ubiquinone/menaquinone biosynthesis C-methylase UbiE
VISARFAEKPELIQGYHEYRRASYVLLYQAIAKEGLLEFFAEPRTCEAAAAEFGCRPDRMETLRAVLGVLVALGVLGQRPATADGHTTYLLADRKPDEAVRPVDVAVLRKAIGEERADAVVYAQQIPEAITYLRGEREGNEFGTGQLARWQSLLEFPYWDFGRRVCAQTVATPGGRAVDLACGLGHGVRELASLVGPSGSVLGIEMSPDFVELANKDLPANCEIRQGDMNDGVGFLDDASIDGAMISGAFHFVRDKAGFLADLHRAIAPGGKVALGNVVRLTTAFDQAAHDITCSMLQPPVLMETPEQLAAKINQSGFELADSFGEFGCVGWYELVKR